MALCDLFQYASGFAAQRTGTGGIAPIRIVHWLTDDAGSGIRCAYDSHPGSPNRPSMLVIPGNEQATLPAASGSPLSDWLRRQHANGVVLAAVCGGVFHLARTGLLDGRKATTHWALSHQFAAQFPNVQTDTAHMVIDYGDVVTAGGVLAWADLGLRLTERLFGPTIMLETARYMLVDPPRREQRFYSDFNPMTHHGDEVILNLQQWLAAQPNSSVTVAELAQHARLESRTFLRRFVRATGMKPSEYQQRLRISRARELLEFSRTGIEVIASRVGYEDARAFRRVFQKIVGLTPSDYRRRFSGPYEHSGATARTVGTSVTVDA